MRRPAICGFVAGIVLLMASLGAAEVRVIVGHRDADHATPQFKFDNVPPPSVNDAARDATFTVLFGGKDGRSGGPDKLHDGKLPSWEDQPEENFCLSDHDGGRLLVDLGRTVDIAQVNSYSWHPSTRAPQVYKLYGSDGTAAGFNARPGKGTDPASCGWAAIASVDSRPKSGDSGGQYGVSVTNPDGSLGAYRYLLFDIARTEFNDDWGNTFYSEIDVVEHGGPPAEPVPATTFAPFPTDPPDDPMDWHPAATAPALQEHYDAATYDRLKKAVLAGIDEQALRAPDRPIDGMLVRHVEPNGQADRLGIRVGDILMALDGAPLGMRTGDQELNALRGQAPQQLTFWSPRGQKTVTIQPGLIGVNTFDGWRAADAYARSPDRDPRWDDDMFVAASTYMSDVNLAETALARAQRTGYDGRLLTPLSARIAFGQCRFAESLALQWPAFAHGRRLNDDTVSVMNEAALLSFKFEQSLALARRYPDLLGSEEDVAAAVAAYRSMPVRRAPNPVAEADDLHPERFAKLEAFAGVPQDSPIAQYSKWAAPQFEGHSPVHVDVPSGHYMPFAFTPGLANAALAIHFELHETDQTATPFARSISVGMFDLNDPQSNGPDSPDMRVALLTDGGTTIKPLGMPEHKWLSARAGTAGVLRGTIRMVVLHNRCEITLDDGRRLYYGPALSDEGHRRFAFNFVVVGMTGVIYPPIWEKVDDAAAIPATKP